MTPRYALSIEHSDVRRLFLETENTKGGIEAFKIKLKEDVPFVWNEPPHGEIKAHRVEYEGIDGFIFMNPNDNYCRYDFYTSEYLSEEPELISVETPEKTRIAQEHEKEQKRKAEIQARQLENQAKLREFEQKILRERYDNCLKVNEKFGPVYDISDFESFLKKNEGKYVGSFSKNPFLDSVNRFEDRYGKTPELMVPNEGTTREKLKILSEQLQREEFRHEYGFHLKLQDLGRSATVSVYDFSDNVVSFMKAPWEKRKLELDFFTSIEFDETTAVDIDCYSLNLSDASHVELGKKVDYDDLKFPDLFDLLADIEFADMKSEDVSFEYLATNGRDGEIMDLTEFRDKEIMEHLLNHESVLRQVQNVIGKHPVPVIDRQEPETTLDI